MSTLYLGDCLEVMAGMEAGSVDAVVTDPPYGLAFMGKEWDRFTPGDVPMRRNPEMDAVNTGMSRQGGRQRACTDYAKRQARDMRHFQEAMTAWAEVTYPILKPSSYLLAFGGTRTWHRLACALEDAGFEIRDTLMWLYGSGFPKGKACLKPAWEPIILARKAGPTRELGIEECRISHDDESSAWVQKWSGHEGHERGLYGGNVGTQFGGSPSGRWPANLVLDEEAARFLDQSTPILTSGTGAVKRATGAGWNGNALGTESRPAGTPNLEYGDSGGASRFFYTAKASRSERNEGCDGLGVSSLGVWGGEEDDLSDGKKRCLPAANHHPTVKPVALMRWLVRLVARPGDVVCDPFLGSGTTGVACAKEGRQFIGIEKEAAYYEIAKARIETAEAQLMLPVP